MVQDLDFAVEELEELEAPAWPWIIIIVIT